MKPETALHIWYVIMADMAVFLAQHMLAAPGQTKAILYSEFNADLQAGKTARVIASEQDQGTFQGASRGREDTVHDGIALTPRSRRSSPKTA